MIIRITNFLSFSLLLFMIYSPLHVPTRTLLGRRSFTTFKAVSLGFIISDLLKISSRRTVNFEMATAKTSLVETAAKASSFNKNIEVHDDKIAFKMAGR